MELKMNYLVRFSRKSGKIDKTLSGMGSAMLKLWGIQNCPKTKDIIVFDEDGTVIVYIEGTGDFPKVCKDMTGKHIDEFCPGLLNAVIGISKFNDGEEN